MSNVNESLLNPSQANEPQSNDKQEPLSEIEKLVGRVGGESTYQIISFAIFCFMWFVTSWLLVGEAFFFDASYKCYDIEDKEQCQAFICKSPSSSRSSLISEHSDSIVFAFDNFMICDYQYLVTVLQSMLFIGSLTGFFVFPYIADNWGRKIGIQSSWAVSTVGIGLLAFADGAGMVGLGYFLAGFGSNPAITLCLTFVNQETLGKSRQFYGVGVQLFLALGEGTIGFMFITSLHWYQVGYVLLGMSLVGNLFLLYMVESPKFLIKKNKAEALKALNIIAVRNKKQIISEESFNEVDLSKELNQQSGASFVDLFKYRSLRRITIATGMIFLAISSIYYCVSLNLDSIGSSKLVNQQIVAGSEFASYIFAEIMINKVFRRKYTMIGLSISSLMCFLIAILTAFEIDQNQDTMMIIETISLLINRFVLCSTWGIFYVFIAELFPTPVRSLGFGWASALGTIGSSVAPYIRLVSEMIGISAWISPGVLGLLGVLSAYFLAETWGKQLKNEIQERLTGEGEVGLEYTDQQEDLLSPRGNSQITDSFGERIEEQEKKPIVQERTVI